MELLVNGKRVRCSKKVTMIERKSIVQKVSLSTTVLPCRKLVLNICINLPKERLNEFDTMTFKLVHDVQIVLLHMHNCRNQVIPYPYISPHT